MCSSDLQQQVELQKQLQQNQGQMQNLKQSADSLREHFLDVAIPFMKSQLGQGEISESDEKELRRMAATDGAQPFLSKFGPMMVKASAAATSRLQVAQQDALTPELQRQFDAFRALRNPTVESNSTSWYATGVSAPYMNQPPPMPAAPLDVNASYGWTEQPKRARVMHAAASSSSSAAASVPAAEYGDEFSLSAMG